ncbi:ribosomal large subunit pseudouridine synthase B [mine drainage metagenome]|uniref:Ribosomal large subunit pseudouridine synthase B n=1 Tax=mine drainage metagenome TaxID=410659 RepID=A0A1J5PZP8_9ZZZZ
MNKLVRLQKVLAEAGVASRRACEEIIAQGRVRVNGKIVREMGLKVDPETAKIEVDGEEISSAQARTLLAFNKPAGVVSAMSDPQGRTCLGDFFSEWPGRLFHVGRLDFETEGLILLTNDGDLANRLAHPKHEVGKRYLVQIRGVLPNNLTSMLKSGVELEDGLVRLSSVKILARSEKSALLEIELHEGRNRIIRRLFAQLDLPVEHLVRIGVGSIDLGELRPGRWRAISEPELNKLLAE